MALYLVGDVRGCDEALGQLLNRIDFSPSRDRLVVLGNLVSKGPSSLAVVRRLQALGDSAQCLLGANDLHALAVAGGLSSASPHDNLDELLTSPEAPALFDWMRHRLIGWYEEEILMVSAGLLPQWDAMQTIAVCAELSWKLRQRDWVQWLAHVYEKRPERWGDELEGLDRERVVINAVTRIRYCTVQGEADFATNDGMYHQRPPVYVPWFDVPGRKTENVTVAFGHWPELGVVNRSNIIALDSGCAWGGQLSAMRVDGQRRELIQINSQ
jgi:bis(5'-nucleosyl)-tetraphosphatase (symmetrical)